MRISREQVDSNRKLNDDDLMESLGLDEPKEEPVVKPKRKAINVDDIKDDGNYGKKAKLYSKNKLSNDDQEHIAKQLVIIHKIMDDLNFSTLDVAKHLNIPEPDVKGLLRGEGTTKKEYDHLRKKLVDYKNDYLVPKKSHLWIKIIFVLFILLAVGFGYLGYKNYQTNQENIRIEQKKKADALAEQERVTDELDALRLQKKTAVKNKGKISAEDLKSLNEKISTLKSQEDKLAEQIKNFNTNN